MSETTTIAITKPQKDRLDTLKLAESESYKDVLTRLMDEYETAGQETGVAYDSDLFERINQLDKKMETLDRILGAAQTAEERTGSIQRQLEDMGGR